MFYLFVDVSQIDIFYLIRIFYTSLLRISFIALELSKKAKLTLKGSVMSLKESIRDGNGELVPDGCGVWESSES